MFIYVCMLVCFSVCDRICVYSLIFSVCLFAWLPSVAPSCLSHSPHFLLSFFPSLSSDRRELCVHPEELVVPSGSGDVSEPAGRVRGVGRSFMWHRREGRRELRMLGQEEEEKEGTWPGGKTESGIFSHFISFFVLFSVSVIFSSFDSFLDSVKYIWLVLHMKMFGSLSWRVSGFLVWAGCSKSCRTT